MTDVVITLQNSLADLPAAGLFMALFAGTFVSEDATCVLAGTAVASGRMEFAAAATACFLGIAVGDILLFYAGRVLGSRLLSSNTLLRFVSEKSLENAGNWLERNAVVAVFFSRFVSGMRLPTYLLAGSLRTRAITFAALFALASAIWAPLLVGAAAYSQKYLFGTYVVGGVVVLIMAARFLPKALSWRSRRLAFGRLKRIVKWEFWPVQIFYLPVVAYCLYLGARYGLTSFTAANPAMPAGGFKGESKAEIYGALERSRGTAKHLPTYELIRCSKPLTERLQKIWQFMDGRNFEFPVVVKPDAGERGKGVKIVRSLFELEDIVSDADQDLIVQEYIDGVEASIFYYRRPGEERGQIYSITEKRFPSVTGDGASTVEELVLRDPRAVCLASRYFEFGPDRSKTVPIAGEEITLTGIGAHSRGAIFLDGEWLRTAHLTERIDSISRDYDGFYFGRFDIRAATFNDIRDGAGFQIIELNGVTSESTNIYDPGYSLLSAYRILFRQWRIAFEIGAENVRLGVKATTPHDLFKLAVGRNQRPGATYVCRDVMLGQ